MRPWLLARGPAAPACRRPASPHRLEGSREGSRSGCDSRWVVVVGGTRHNPSSPRVHHTHRSSCLSGHASSCGAPALWDGPSPAVARRMSRGPLAHRSCSTEAGEESDKAVRSPPVACPQPPWPGHSASRSRSPKPPQAAPSGKSWVHP